MKYIIDTDPGVDDAVAIMMAVKNNLDIKGFTLVSGNVPYEKSENNLKIIQDFLNTNIKMYKGVKNDAIKTVSAEHVHGKDGLGYCVFPESKRKYEKLSAEDYIIKASKKYKDDLTLVCLGPLTNLANAIKKDKKLPGRIKHLIIMGATYDPGATEDYIEFNVSVDPEASKLVFESDFEDIKLITHEIGVKAFIEKSYIDKLRNSEDIISRFIASISQKYIEFNQETFNISGLCCPDPSTISSIVDESIIEYKPCSVIMTDKNTTHVDLVDESNIKVAVKINLEKFREIFKKTFK